MSVATMVAVAAMAMACTGPEADPAVSSPAAAKVGAEEISVHQVDYVLQRAGSIPQDAAEGTRRRVLEKLVDQQLLVEQAQQKKLDRDPDIILAIDAARRDIVARAYMEQLASSQPRPSAQEVRQYYVDHAALFADRKVFTLQEIALSKGQGLADSLHNMVSDGRSLADIEDWLKRRQLKYTLNTTARPAEQIPLEMLPRVHALKEGALMVVQSPAAINVIRLAATQPAPMDEATALPRIEQFLFNQRSSELVDRELRRMRQSAKIEYVGEFAGRPANAAALEPRGQALPGNVATNSWPLRPTP